MKIFYMREILLQIFVGYIVLLHLLISCSTTEKEKDKRTDIFRTQGMFILTPDDEKILLRGVNISHTAKFSYAPWVGEEELRVLAERFGLNFVRLTIFWKNIEPERGRYDIQYIEKIRQVIRWCEKHSVYVMLDMHQDLFGFQAHGEGSGMPEWARDNECPSFKNLSPWFVNYLDDSISCQFDSFWKNKNSVLSDFIKAWVLVVKELGQEKAVIGFDVINEPWPGSYWKDDESRKYWEQNILTKFYNQIIKEIRKYSEKIIFYETHPLSDFGAPVNILKPEGENLAYVPHIYTITGTAGQTRPGWNQEIDLTFSNHYTHAQKYNVPIVVGEYGIGYEHPLAAEISRYFIDKFDENFVGSAIWSFDKAPYYDLATLDEYLNPLTNFAPVIRPYPEKVKGEILEIDYDKDKLKIKARGDYIIFSCPQIKPCFGDKIGKVKFELDRNNPIDVEIRF
jgi:endoglycosylceramidase